MLPAVARSERALSMPACPPAKVMELTCRLPTCRIQRSIHRRFACHIIRQYIVPTNNRLCPPQCARPGFSRSLLPSRSLLSDFSHRRLLDMEQKLWLQLMTIH